MSSVILAKVPVHIQNQISSHQELVNNKLGRLVADSTSVGTILGNFLAARTKEFTSQNTVLQTDAEESIAACALVASHQKHGNFFEHFISHLKQCSWTFSDQETSVQSIDVTSFDPKRVVDKELERSLRLDYYLLAKLANEGLEDDISLPVKDAFSHLAVKHTDPVTVHFMVGVLDFDISVTDGKVIVEFVYFTYELGGVPDLYGTETCTNVKAARKQMSFNWAVYKDEDNTESMKEWVKEIFYTDDEPPQPKPERQIYIQETLLRNNIVSLTDDVINWVGNHVDNTFTVIVKKNADYENSAFNAVLFRCIQIFGTLKRHGTGWEERRNQTLDITAFLHVPLWGRVRLGTGSTVLEASPISDGNSKSWTQIFSIPGVVVCTLTFDLEKDPELWCAALLDGPLTGPLNTKVHILNVDW